MEDIDWNDPHFNPHSEFQDAMLGDSDSPFTAFNDFTNIPDQYGADGSSPGLALRAPSKTGGAQSQQAPAGMPLGPSTESSSQDSASDSSSRRKRKVSESPISDPMAETGVKQEDAMMDMAGNVDSKIPQFGGGPGMDQQYPTRPMNDLSLEHDNGLFDFNSAASSPVASKGYNTAMSLNRQVQVPVTTGPMGGYQQSPVSRAHPPMASTKILTDVADADDQSAHVPAEQCLARRLSHHHHHGHAEQCISASHLQLQLVHQRGHI